MIDIRVMTDKDIDFGLKMTDMEKWGYLRSDFERLIYFEPKGCFIAYQDNVPVGLVTTSSYGDYAFLGTLIVDKPYRGAKIGQMLMEHSIDYLREKGVATIELDGVFQAVPLYRRVGFKDKYLSYRLTKIVEGRNHSLERFQPEMLDELIVFDKCMTGLERERYLARFAEDFCKSIYICKIDGLKAYAIVRPRAEKRVTVGPMVSENSGYAEMLLHSIMAKYSGYMINLGVLETNRAFVELLRCLGFIYNDPCLRMYLGEYRDYERHIYGIISAEKG